MEIKSYQEQCFSTKTCHWTSKTLVLGSAMVKLVLIK